jgi:hypothetical protein
METPQPPEVTGLLKAWGGGDPAALDRLTVDAARARGSHKRGGGAEKVNVDDVAVISPQPGDAVEALDAALEEFAKLAPRQAKIVEIAEVMKTSTRTIERDWRFARSWLMRELTKQ